jgi:hypothetical protein
MRTQIQIKLNPNQQSQNQRIWPSLVIQSLSLDTRVFINKPFCVEYSARISEYGAPVPCHIDKGYYVVTCQQFGHRPTQGKRNSAIQAHDITRHTPKFIHTYTSVESVAAQALAYIRAHRTKYTKRISFDPRRPETSR